MPRYRVLIEDTIDVVAPDEEMASIIAHGLIDPKTFTVWEDND